MYPLVGLLEDIHNLLRMSDIEVEVLTTALTAAKTLASTSADFRRKKKAQDALVVDHIIYDVARIYLDLVDELVASDRVSQDVAPAAVRLMELVRGLILYRSER